MAVYLGCLVGLVTGPFARCQEWTRFRGPNGSGLSSAITVPVHWTEKDYNWKIKLPGKGNSSPVLWGDKLFVTAGDNETGKRIVQCVNAVDGKNLWTREFEARPYKMHLRSSIATATPAVDKDRLYVTWATPDQYTAMGLDHDGKLVWQANLGPFKSQHGFGVSPIVHEDLVIVGNDQDGGGSLIALDSQNGKVRWQLPRNPKNATYSTPCVYQRGQAAPELIFTNWQHGITAVDPKTGKATWEISVFDTAKQERAIASPVVAGDLILGTCGFVTAQKHLVAVRPGDPQQGVKPKEVWRIEKAVSYLPTPLVKGERVYCCSEQGIATCLDQGTGKVIWQERVTGSYSGSPVCVGEHIYCVSNSGDVLVLAASDKFRVVARNALGEGTQSTPAVAGGRIFFRTETHVISIGGSR
jgi:outer membrane protein assembly factor BamB